MQWSRQFIASAISIIQFSSRLTNQSATPWWSSMEFNDAINKYSSSFTLDPDHVSWNYLKEILSNVKYCSNIVNIANTCINLSYWLSHFKKLLFIIILKLKISLYDTLKAFCSIVLLNMLGKLIEKAISNRPQVYTIISNFIYSSQLEGIK